MGVLLLSHVASAGLGPPSQKDSSLSGHQTGTEVSMQSRSKGLELRSWKARIRDEEVMEGVAQPTQQPGCLAQTMRSPAPSRTIRSGRGAGCTLRNPVMTTPDYSQYASCGPSGFETIGRCR